MKNLLVLIAFIPVLSWLSSHSQNPVVPPGTYIADPSARVWNDGKIYIYGSQDVSTDHYCSWKYAVLSSDDMLNWTVHPESFSTKGENDEVPYNDGLLFAPDCRYFNGTYYLYYCQPITGQIAGVATSDSPTGPFTNGQQMYLGEKEQIDPNVFIDDDGTAYYIWGQFSLKIAKLKPNMTEIDTTSVIDGLITEEEHFFHEGANMRKRNGIYYLVYADMSRGDSPTCIGYATSTSPTGPFEYKGVIIDNRYSDPGVWNNHGSIEKYNDQWYVFYHRSTHHSAMMRKACIEPISFNEDGTIDEVEMTSQGAGPPLNATSTIDAASACLVKGNVRIQAYTDIAEELGEIRQGDKVAWKYLDFGEGVDKIIVKVKPGKDDGGMLISTDQVWGERLGVLHVPAATKETENQWIEIEQEITKTQGVKALWFRFYASGEDIFSIDSFRFE